MELTGKCKEDFEKWLYNSEHAKHVYCSYQESGNAPNYEFKYEDVKLPEILENALIIDFFDSVEIYIDTDLVNIDCVFTANLFHEKHRTKIGKTITSIRNFNSRPEAQTEAIKKANKIYNEK